MADELPRGKHGGYELRAIDDGVEPALQEPDHVGAGIAFEPPRFFIDAAEVPLRHVGVVALELLLGAQLHAVIGELALAPLAVLAGAVFALVDGRLRPAPDVLSQPAVDLVLRLVALGHSRPRLFGHDIFRKPVTTFRDHAALRIAPSSVPGMTGTDRSCHRSAGTNHGSRNTARATWGPRRARFLGGKADGVKPRACARSGRL